MGNGEQYCMVMARSSGRPVYHPTLFIPSLMIFIAKTEVARAKKLSENARQLAKWIETHSDKFYRHANFPDMANNEPLRGIQIMPHAISVQEVCIVSISFSACRNRGPLDRR